MKDITTRSFGLLIAYLLPGIACFCYMSLWLRPFQDLLKNFMKSTSDIGSFLFVVLVALLLGLILNAFRWFIYEKIFLKGHSLSSDYFVTISKENRLMSIHTAIDENFRYHQFYGNLSLIGLAALITFAFRLLGSVRSDLKTLWYAATIAGTAILCVIVEIVIVWTAVESFFRYVDRGTKIMKGGSDAQRSQKEGQEKGREEGQEEGPEEEGPEEEGQEEDQEEGQEENS